MLDFEILVGKSHKKRNTAHENGSATHSIAIREENGIPLEGPRPIQLYKEGEK